jgi:type-F conjugative transfer system pilin assembly protein TrbC
MFTCYFKSAIAVSVFMAIKCLLLLCLVIPSSVGAQLTPTSSDRTERALKSATEFNATPMIPPNPFTKQAIDAKTLDAFQQSERVSKAIANTAKSQGVFKDNAGPSTGTDIDAVLKSAERDNVAGKEPVIQIMVGISFSMPDEAINKILLSARKVGAGVVIRGTLDGSLQKTLAKMQKIQATYPGVAFAIDPTFFQQFNVQTVPTFVVSRRAPALDCNGVCTSTPNSSVVSGDVSLGYALEYIGRNEKKLGDIARFASRTADKLKGE